jgi:hypothetical protein
MSLNRSRGAIRFATGRLSKRQNKDIRVTTPAAALAVRGTEIWVGIVDLQYGAPLLSETGRVDVSNSDGEVSLSEPGPGTDLPPSLKDEYAPGIHISGQPTKWDMRLPRPALVWRCHRLYRRRELRQQQRSLYQERPSRLPRDAYRRPPL